MCCTFVVNPSNSCHFCPPPALLTTSAEIAEEMWAAFEAFGAADVGGDGDGAHPLAAVGDLIARHKRVADTLERKTSRIPWLAGSVSLVSFCVRVCVCVCLPSVSACAADVFNANYVAALVDSLTPLIPTLKTSPLIPRLPETVLTSEAMEFVDSTVAERAAVATKLQKGQMGGDWPTPMQPVCAWPDFHVMDPCLVSPCIPCCHPPSPFCAIGGRVYDGDQPQSPNGRRRGHHHHCPGELQSHR